MAQIVAKTKDGDHEISFDYDFGDTLEASIAKFGLEIVTAHAHRSLTIAAQGAARGMMKSGKDRDAIIAAMKDWKPGEPRQAKSKEEKMREMVAAMTPEQLEALQAEIKAAAKAQKAPK